jgi:DEAD/DEAH box helicase domain-containing protein
VHDLLREAATVTPLPELQATLFPEHTPADAALLLQSLLGLVSHAQRPVGEREMPLLTVQLQLWCRELRRMLRALPDQADGALLPPTFTWFTDEPDGERDDHVYGTQAHCRECGITGFAGVQTESDRERGRVNVAPAAVGMAWQTRSRDARFLWPRPLDEDEREGELVYWVDPASGSLNREPPKDSTGRTRGGPVVLEATLTAHKTNPRFAGRCPACGSDDALSIIGARGASLTSVAVTHLYQAPFNADKKLLAFTDSVQDATHRAGFFGGRTFRIHLRTAIQAVVAAQDGPLRLSDAAKAFEAHWRTDDAQYLADFLPPDLRALPEVRAYIEAEGAGKHPALWRILRSRVAWEITREYGVASGVGRSLERSAASAVQIDPQRLDQAATRLGRWLREEGLHENPDAEHFLFGLVHRLRQMGGILHPFLTRYIQDDGNRFKLTKAHAPHMSPVGPRSKRIRFLADRRLGEVFPSPFGQRALRGWYADWLKRSLDFFAPTTADMERIYRRALEALVAAGILTERAGKGRQRVWGLEPAALLLTTDVAAVRAGARHLVLARPDAERCNGKPAFRFRSTHRLRTVDARPGYYATVYSRGLTTRVHAGEHTGLLANEARTELESRFKQGTTAADPTAPNLLVCTPTLEMGVDIGDLSAAMLCSVPPTPANYLQRVGRAGRKTGNALVFTMAISRPHDMYFHAEPTAMLDGTVLPPGAYLGAPAMLTRQLVAWCMDAWATEDDGASNVPGTAAQVLGQVGRAQFPGRFLEHFGTHRQRLLDGFLERFDQHLTANARTDLNAYVRSADGLVAHVQGAFDELAGELVQYESERNKARKRLAAIAADPTQVADPEGETRELKRFLAVINHLMADIRRTYPLNVLTDAGVLPNYAFPESGVGLDAMITSRDADDARQVERRSYLRPAARALRELAPFNTFYAEGHKVQIRQIEVGPRASRVERWRFCRCCHFVQRRLSQPDEPPESAVCPRCGDEDWKDKGRVHAMLPMRSVRSVADRVRSTITDATEERDVEAYNIHRLFDVPPDQVQGARWLPSQGFGFEYVDRITLTEVNLGLQSAMDGAPKVMLADHQASAEGFATCTDCGEVADPRPWMQSRGTAHAPYCPQRKGDTKPREPLYLYREVRSEAIRFLLPIAEVGVDDKLATFRAALDYALRLRFRGQPIHLTVASMTEPNPEDRSQRKHFLVLFDTVPGGTGYLAQFREDGAIFDLLEPALHGLRNCSCRARGQDGCYLCLYGHAHQRDLPHISSRLAEHLLAGIVGARHEAIDAPHGLTPIQTDVVIESELEERLLDALGQAVNADLSAGRDDGGHATFIAGETTWRLEPQVDVTEAADQPSRADFVLTAIKGPGLDQRVVVECDSIGHHVEPDKPRARLAADFAKRTAIAARPGWAVFAVTWNDVIRSKTSGRLPRALSSNRWSTIWDKALAKTLPSELSELPRLEPMPLLLAYLHNPTADWEDAAAGVIAGSLLQSYKAKTLVRAQDYHGLVGDLRYQPELAPHAELPSADRTGPRDLFARVIDEDHLKLAISAQGTAVKRPDPAKADATLRLDDTHAARQAETFAPTWRKALQTFNLLQFLPRFEAVTTEQLLGDEDPAFETIAPEPVASPPAPRPDLPDYHPRAYPGELWELLQAVLTAGLPPPDAFPEELPSGLPADLMWTKHRVALLAEADEDLSEDREAGWTVLVLPVTLDAIRDALAAQETR